MSKLKIAIAHWRPRSWGGAEYLITKIAEVLNIDKIYTLGTLPEKNPYGNIEFYDITKDLGFSILKRLQLKFDRIFEYSIWESVDWSMYGDFDVVISSGSTTRAIITPDDVMHVNYCHSPPRWLYDLYHRRIKNVRAPWIYAWIIGYLRIRDFAVDSRVDYYLVNSPIIKRRLWKYYKRDSKILYPPIDISKYKYIKYKNSENYYLYLGRLDREKGILEIVKAFEKLNLPLKIAGSKGDAFEEVMKIVERCRNIEYVGFVSEEEKIELLSRCRAVVFNAVNEDFGIVPIEANAAGKLCISVRSGYPGLFIKDGVNGFLHDGSVRGIMKAVRKVEKEFGNFDPENIRNHVMKFDINNFKDRLREYLTYFYQEFNSKLSEDY